MSFLVIFLLFIGLLFATAFFTKRRFGVLGLALAAGAMLSNLWVGDLTPIIASAGIIIVKPPLSSLVSAGLILLPALLLLASGPTYKSMVQRVVGAGAFAVLAIALLLEPLGSALVIDTVGKPVYDFFVEQKVIIITAALILAILDLLVSKSPKRRKEYGEH
ncbi:MAG TPA: hypothetical protein VK502_01000 [Candidatus Saccharimonadales bacterium]|nr:hypothetical protein [Candidatus Saccharimonadales bacterium]